MARPPPAQGGGGGASGCKHLPRHELPVQALGEQRDGCKSERDKRQDSESAREATACEGPPERTDDRCDHQKPVDDVHGDLPFGWCPACRTESAVVRPTRSALTCQRRVAAALS